MAGEKQYIKYAWDDPADAPILATYNQEEADYEKTTIKRGIKAHDYREREGGVWYEYDVVKATQPGERDQLVNGRLYCASPV